MNNVLTTIGVVLVLILSVLFIAPLAINWDGYRPNFEATLSQILGSKVELDGSLNVRLLPSPYVYAENLRIGESGIKGQPILDVKALTLWVSVPPLLKGVIEASRVTLDQPKLVLQFDEAGRLAFRARNGQTKKSKNKSQENTPFEDTTFSVFQLSPNLISLKNVQIINGDVVFSGAGRPSLEKPRQLSLSGVEGVLSAVTLNGPFHFIGGYKEGDHVNKVRLAIGVQEKSSYPVRAKMVVAGGREILFDGEAHKERDAWGAKGKLKAILGGFSGAVQTRLDAGGNGVVDEGGEKSFKKDPLNIDGAKIIDGEKTETSVDLTQEIVLNSSVNLSARGVLFDNIVIRGGSLAHPQTMRGKASVHWHTELSLIADIDGKVIDLNQLYKSSLKSAMDKGEAEQIQGGDLQNASLRGSADLGTIAPGDALMGLSDFLLRQAAWFEVIDIKAKVTQLTVGRGDVGDFRLNVKGDKGKVEVKEFYGKLPGSGRMSVNGMFETKKNGPSFDGSLFLRGLQFETFLNWAMPHMKGGDDYTKGKYMLSGTVSMNDAGFSLNDAKGVVAGTSLSGGIVHSRLPGDKKLKGDKQQGFIDEDGVTRFRLRAGEIDTEDLLGRRVPLKDYEEAIAAVVKLWGGGAQGQDKSKTSTVLSRSKTTEIELLIEKVVFSDAVQKDVVLLWRADKTIAGLVSFSMVSEAGLGFSYENDGDKTNGERFVIEGSQASAVTEFINLTKINGAKINGAKINGAKINGTGDQQVNAQLIERLLPFRLAVRRQSVEGALHYRVDGVVAGSNTAFSMLVPGVEDDDAQVTIFGGMDNEDGNALVARLLPFQFGRSEPLNQSDRLKRQETRNDEGGDESGRLSFFANGSLGKGFQGQFNFQQKDLSLTYKGVLGLGASRFASDGILDLKGDESAKMLALFGLDGLSFTKDQKGPFSAKMTFSQTPNGYALSDLRVGLGQLKIRGAGVSEKSDGTPNLNLALVTSKLDLNSLLGALTDGGLVARDDQSVQDEVWSKGAFFNGGETQSNKGANERPGKRSFSLRLDELALTDQLSLADVKVSWELEGDRIEITKIEGKSLGGTFLASGILRRVATGYSFNGVANLTGGQLDKIGARSEVDLGDGEFSLNLSMSGAGNSVHDLVASLVGEGGIQIKEGHLRQLNPTTLEKLAVGYLNDEKAAPEKLKEALLSEIESAERVVLGSIDLGLQLIDGKIKLRAPDLGVRPGVIGLEGVFDLEDLAWQGDWKIQAPDKRVAKGASPSKKKSGLSALPPVYRSMSGRFVSEGAVVAKLDMSDFERYLDLKYKEKELKRLEKERLERQAKQLAQEKLRAQEELKRIERERARLKAQKEALENLPLEDLDRSDLPLLVP